MCRSGIKRKKRRATTVKEEDTRKSRKSMKAKCLAFVKVTKEEDGRYKAVIFGRHTHEHEIKHVGLSEETKMHIRLQSSLGVDAHTIIEKHNKRFWSNYSSFGDKKSRDAFLSMKEVTNLREASKRRKNDVTSVEMLKEEIDEISKKHNHAS